MTPMSVEITKVKANRNTILATYFQLTWDAAPDQPHIHGIPGWSLLCDLCSESHVLFTKEENQENEQQ